MLTPDELRDFQDQTFAIGQSECWRVGDVVPQSFIFFRRSALEAADGIGMDGAPLEVGAPGSGLVMMPRPWAMTWEDKYVVLFNEMTDRQRGFFAAALAIAERMEVDDKYMRTVRPLMDVQRLTDHDVVSMGIRQLCAAVDAFAVVSIVTGYVLHGGRDIAKHAGNVAKHPESREGLYCHLESRTITRFLTAEVLRDGHKKGEGTVTGFGKLEDISTDVSPGVQSEGRFAQFLRPLPPSGVCA